MKHRAWLIASAALLLTGCGAEPAADSAAESTTEPPAAPTEKNMVTLGDSISYGYGLEDSSHERYSVLLRQMLEERDGITWKDYNYSLSGDDSTDLLFALKNGRALRLPSADVIVMCIGANNVLGVYSEYIMEQADKFEIDYETVTEEQIAEIQEQLEEDMQNQEHMKQVFQERIDSNLTQLESDLEETYRWIRERNTEAQIYVLNVYNPYTADVQTGMFGEDDVSFYEFADAQIVRLNGIINTLTETHDDLIYVDIAAAFAACEMPPVIGTTGFGVTEGEAVDYYDPHPTAEGQRIIAETVYAAMETHT